MKKRYSLTKSQKRIWFESRADSEAVRNIVLVYELTGNLDPHLIEQAMLRFVSDHDIFRSSFSFAHDRLDCWISDDIFGHVEFLDLSANFSESQLHLLLQEIKGSKFQFTTGPLFRFVLIKVAEQSFRFALVVHPLILNRFGIKKFVAEVINKYLEVSGNPVPETEEQYQSLEYTLDSENAFLESQKYHDGVQYFANTLKNNKFFLKLPKSGFYPGQLIKHNRIRRRLSAETSQMLRDFAQQYNTEIFTVILGAYQILLSRYSGAKDIIVNHSYPVVYNDDSYINKLLPLRNFVPLRTLFHNGINFVQLIKELAAQAVYDSYYSSCPINDVIKTIRNRYDTHFDGLFSNVAIEKSYLPLQEINIPGIKAKLLLDYASKLSKENLVLYFNEEPGEIPLVFEIDDSVDNLFVEYFADHLVVLLQQLLKDPNKSVFVHQFLLPYEYDLVVNQWNQAPTNYAPKSVTELFAHAAHQHKENFAVVLGEKKLTYQELDEKTNQLARYLNEVYQQKMGESFPRGALIGLSMRRSLEMIISTLAIVKAGGVYVPLDPNYPEDRLRFMLKDTAIKIVLTQVDIKEKIGHLFNERDCAVIDIDQEWDKVASLTKAPLTNIVVPDDLIYIIYTSGSTGEPKGAMIEHRAVTRLVKETNYIDILPSDHIAQASNIAFDAATLEIWGALLNGAALYLVPNEILLKTDSFATFLQENQITILWLTVALFNQYALEHPNMFGGLRYLMAGGDALTPEIIYKVLAAETAPQNLLNGYGPTENTTFTTTYNIQHELPAGQSIPIGKPITNTTCYILDDQFNPVPVGVEGELYAGGEGVARGYLHRDDLTAEKFIQNPFTNDPKSRLYKTGDVVRWLPDGNIEFIGRKDTQVKIRGFRIEIGEIEHAILELPIIKQAVVVVCQHPQLGKLLAAYFVTNTREVVKENEIRKMLGQHLPEYMLPTYFIQLEFLPVTPNGKVDKRALPDPFGGKTQGGQKASNAIEEVLVEIWEELFSLGSKKLDANSDFFELGGHSLLATQLVSRIKGRLKIEVPVKEVFQNTTIKSLANFLSKQQAQQVEKFVLQKVSREQEFLPLSFAEQRVYFLHQIDSTRIVYNIPFVFKFNQLDIGMFIETFNIFVQRQEIFRTAFIEVQNEVYRQILPELHVDIPVYNAEKTDPDLIKRLSKTPFDLARAPLFAVALFKHNDGSVSFFFNIHHIVFDGWSLQYFMDELGAIYSQLKSGVTPEAKPLSYSYTDYAYSQKQWCQFGYYEEQLEYWLQKLSGELPVLDIPTDFQHPSFQSFNGDVYHYEVPEHLSKELHAFCRKKKVSLYALLLTVYNILLYRYTGQTDILVGSPIANRLQKESENIIGLFVNLIVHRNAVLPSMSFEDLLKEVQQEVIEANENQGLPFDMLVSKVKPPKQVSQNPIFQTMLVLQNGFKISGRWDAANIDYRIQELHQGTSRADIVLIVNEDINDQLSGYAEFNTDLYTRASIANMVERFLYLLNTVLNHPEIEISALSVLTTDEYQHFVADNNKLPAKPPKLKPLHVLFEEVVAEFPDNLAVVAENIAITYKELNARANQLANYIRKRYQEIHKKPLTADTLLGLSVGRDIDMPVAMLAILKAGAAYLPLDPDYPAKRLEYMVQDAQLSLIITTESLVAKNKFLFTNKTAALVLDNEKDAILKESTSNLNNINTTRDLAYIIYTSGSTGQPKGVLIEHKGVPNLCTAQIDAFAITKDSRILQFASINFDAATSEVYTAFLAGAALYIVPDAVRKTPEMLFNYLQENKISVATIPPAVLELLPRKKLPCLKTLVIAGDVCEPETIKYWEQNRRFINAYGPTETTVCATLSVYDKTKLSRQIGAHLPNLQTYVLDNNLQPVPVGVPGELYVSGIGLARGYLNRPDLTIERFVAHPFMNDPQAKMYKTGDLVRWLPSDELEFLGRTDAQVKIRGFRIELGEIESLLNQYTGIIQTAVIIRNTPSDKELIAFYVADPKLEISIDELRKYLSNLLPGYMVPGAFIRLEKMPLNPSGKIDRKVLEKTQKVIGETRTRYVAPKTELEKTLAKIWATLLNYKKVGLDDSFFMLGGHSLLAVKMQSIVREKLKKDFNLLAFIQNPVLKVLVELIEGKKISAQSKSENLRLAQEDSAMIIQIPKKMPYPEELQPKEILLTGVTGFVGVYLLDALLRQTKANVYCIIRADNEKMLQQKFAANVDKYQLAHLKDNPRIKLLSGDLAKENLGLSSADYNKLLTIVDTIYHNGAWVHHVYDYRTLRATNVGSTINLLNMAVQQRPKALHYVSTLSCASDFAADGSLLETGPAEKPVLDNGYLLSKWVSERLLWQARAKGLRTTIYRLGNVTGDSRTGQTNFEMNHALLLLKSCVQLGVAPLWDMKIEMEPVDLAAAALVALSFDKNAQDGVYNLINPIYTTWKEYIAIVNQEGFDVKLIDPGVWLNDYLMPAGEENALYPLKALYEGQAEYSEPPKFYCDKSSALMQANGINYPRDYVKLINLYDSYLIKCGFLPEPGKPIKK